MNAVRTLVSTSSGSLAVLAVAAYLEVQGDACFRLGLHESVVPRRAGWFAVGSLILALYSLLLNSSGVDFGKLLGSYVVLFFLVAQFVAKLQFGQNPTLPIYVGGIFIVTGGLIMTLWKH